MPSPAGDEVLLVLQFDGKGIVMRPEALRPATGRAAAAATPKLATRLSPGEKHGRKRMAELAAVHDAVPVPRAAADIIRAPGKGDPPPRNPGPRAAGKWLTASVTDDIPAVVAAGFDEAGRRDPHRKRAWVALVDGNNAQIDAIAAEAARCGITVPILIDFVHVLEYAWKAAWSFFDKADPAAEEWAAAQAGADECAAYLNAKAPFLDYPAALAGGWPIATGVIEGACRHLVKDMLDITGARWALDGAEAVLKLRAVISNGDFGEYWAFHLRQEHQRIYQAHRQDGETLAA